MYLCKFFMESSRNRSAEMLKFFIDLIYIFEQIWTTNLSNTLSIKLSLSMTPTKAELLVGRMCGRWWMPFTLRIIPTGIVTKKKPRSCSNQLILTAMERSASKNFTTSSKKLAINELWSYETYEIWIWILDTSILIPY